MTDTPIPGAPDPSAPKAPLTPDELQARFRELGLETHTHTHPPVYTVDESKALRGDLPGGHCKNLFLKDKKGRLWLVVAEEDRAIDLKELRKRIGAAQLSFGRPELLMEVLGIEPGAVTPFAIINDRQVRVQVILDARMMRHEVLNYHPLTNAATTTIRPADLLTFLEACGHAPEIMEL